MACVRKLYCSSRAESAGKNQRSLRRASIAVREDANGNVQGSRFFPLPALQREACRDRGGRIEAGKVVGVAFLQPLPLLRYFVDDTLCLAILGAL